MIQVVKASAYLCKFLALWVLEIHKTLSFVNSPKVKVSWYLLDSDILGICLSQHVISPEILQGTHKNTEYINLWQQGIKSQDTWFNYYNCPCITGWLGCWKPLLAHVIGIKWGGHPQHMWQVPSALLYLNSSNWLKSGSQVPVAKVSGGFWHPCLFG